MAALQQPRYNTFDGLWKGITDTFEDFKSKIAGSGSFDYLKDKLTEVSGVLTELEADGTLDKLAVAISDAFVAGAEKSRRVCSIAWLA